MTAGAGSAGEWSASGASSGSGGAAASGGSAAGSGGVAPVAGTGGAGKGGGAGTGGGAGAGGSGGTGSLPLFSFFVASMRGLQTLSQNQEGFGGDLRYGEADGLTGADEICTELAESSLSGSGTKRWRAFLSVTEGPNGGRVNAKDRIGEGPWYDRRGRLVALSLADVLNFRPKGADPLIVNDLPNEFGVPNKDPDGTGPVDNHHVLTGSNSKGELNSTNRGNTCNDWTSAVGSTGTPQCGFSWPRSNFSTAPSSDNQWTTGFEAYGCAPGISIIQNGAGDGTPTVGEGGGYGAIYCFALTP